jgi:hypothetical protein
MWINREMSTYDYLLYLNIIANRSFNDLTQYPIFPWVLGDFQADKPVYARDLTKPMGAQTGGRAERFRIAFGEMKMHYGSHYSHPAAVLYYMMRVEPFTIYNIDLHNGLDHRDRQFSSIAESWRSASESNQSDIKELIPDFYTSPFLFENPNGLDFEFRTDGTSLNQVVLPRWAKDAVDFVWKMRIALETTESIESWIDLIFGYKQRGQAAVDSLNVFQHSCYDDYDEPGNVDQINQFGQCPSQLFKSPHEPRRALTERQTLLCGRLKVALIQPQKGLTSACRTIRMREDLPFFAGRFEHFIGPNFVSIRIWDSYIESGREIFPSADCCQCSSLSRDGNILVIGSALGVIDVVCCVSGIPELMKRIIVPSSSLQAICISTQHGLICGWDGYSIFLIDSASGFFVREISFGQAVVNLEFDEANNFIVVTGKKSLLLLGFDLRVVAQIGRMKNAFTCSCCGDPSLWLRTPIYATGHVDGTCTVWQLSDWTFQEVASMKPSHHPIATVHIFALDRVLLVIDESGDTFSASVEAICMKFLRINLFEKCVVCGASVRNASPMLCSLCGLAVCKACVAARRPVRCTACVQGEEVQAPESPDFGPAKGEEDENEKEITLTLAPLMSQPLVVLEPKAQLDEGAIDLKYRDSALIDRKQESNMQKRKFRHTV